MKREESISTSSAVTDSNTANTEVTLNIPLDETRDQKSEDV